MARDLIDVYDTSIFEMKNVFTVEECQAFIDHHKNSSNKTPGLVNSPDGTAIVVENVKKTTDVIMQYDRSDDHPTSKLIFTYNKGIDKVRSEYTNHVRTINRSCGFGYLNPGFYTAPQIQRTDKGGIFNWHSDYTPDSQDRRLAIIAYLNDIDEENGGSTEFNSGRKVQPERGKVIMFPATFLHLHTGNTILNGPSKYIATTFIVPTANDIYY
tara:strand:+ start:340 stop:978 length:639 start_codon:yes stop_codon:yes gene_type:complete